MARKMIYETPLTNAEKQQRYRKRVGKRYELFKLYERFFQSYCTKVTFEEDMKLISKMILTNRGDL